MSCFNNSPFNVMINSKFVDVCVTVESLPSLLDFLVKNTTPFEVKYHFDSAADPTAVDETKQSLKKKPVGIVEPKVDNIKLVYKKYIADCRGKMVPKIEEIANEIGISPSSFKYKFKQWYGVSFYRAFSKKRMELAKELLAKGFNGNQVAQELGYSHAIKFNKRFQKEFGMTPYKYKLSCLRNKQDNNAHDTV